jgi:hypothetical protein
MAAMYCNWLHNGGAAAAGPGGVVPRENFLDGAYDVSTFGYTGTVFTDQWAHHPGARYWIPTWDEHLKASHYDPALNNDAGGWWRYNISSDTAPVYGPPVVMVNGQPTQANGLWDSSDFPGFSPFNIPLGAYASVQSPWGLFDTAGGTAEWTEEVILTNGFFPTARVFDGSAWASDGTFADLVNRRGGDAPSFSFYDLGFRVASSVPSPGSSALEIGLLLTLSQRRRRKRGSHAIQSTRVGSMRGHYRVDQPSRRSHRNHQLPDRARVRRPGDTDSRSISGVMDRIQDSPQSGRGR